MSSFNSPSSSDLTPGKDGRRSKSTTKSPFKRLSAGCISPRGPEPPGITETTLNSFSRIDSYAKERVKKEGQNTLRSLEGVVSAINETTEVIEQVSKALEDVRRENLMAANVDAAQLSQLLRTSSTWCRLYFDTG